MSGHLNRIEHTTLARAVADVDEIGRLRTSSEHFGRDTRSRDRMLSSLRSLERRGFVIRIGHAWSTGTVTPVGRRYVETRQPPPARRSSYEKRDGGLADDGGTIFKRSVVEIDQSPILANGAQNYKLGRTVTKGPHKGLPLRYVTLEEGRTCPTECALRARCYGGNMPLAKRIRWRGNETGKTIAAAIRQSKPAMIRLHTLGDFPTGAYVAEVYKAVIDSGSAAFGYTHHAPESEIGRGIRALARIRWDRFAIRTSYLHGTRAPIAERSAVIVERPEQAAKHNAVLCPEQQGQVESCGRCGFCWHSQRPVAFVLHANLRKGAGAMGDPA